MNVIAQGFAIYENDNVAITPNQPMRLNVPMTIEVEAAESSGLRYCAHRGCESRKQCRSNRHLRQRTGGLPDDPDELLTDLQALAGPSAGPNGGQLYIDGFTAGQLPPKSSIREIRINQNPFSAEYDKLGYGRIEVFTKPGTDKFHGQLFGQWKRLRFQLTESLWGANQPGYDSTQFSGNLGGPINKKSSFFFDASGETSTIFPPSTPSFSIRHLWPRSAHSIRAHPPASNQYQPAHRLPAQPRTTR